MFFVLIYLFQLLKCAGITYFLGSTPSRYIAEESTQFRTLLKFPELHNFVPFSATILEADITLTFVNYNQDAVLHVCFITKPWNDVESKRFSVDFTVSFIIVTKILVGDITAGILPFINLKAGHNQEDGMIVILAYQSQ